MLIWIISNKPYEGALGTLNSCLNNELHLYIISANIAMFGTMSETIIFRYIDFLFNILSIFLT